MFSPTYPGVLLLFVKIEGSSANRLLCRLYCTCSACLLNAISIISRALEHWKDPTLPPPLFLRYSCARIHCCFAPFVSLPVMSSDSDNHPVYILLPMPSGKFKGKIRGNAGDIKSDLSALLARWSDFPFCSSLSNFPHQFWLHSKVTYRSTFVVTFCLLCMTCPNSSFLKQ